MRHTAHPWLWVCSRSLDPRPGRVGPPLLLLRPSSSPEVGGWSVGLKPRTPAVVELGPCSVGLRRSGVPVCLFVCSQIGVSLLFQGRIPPCGGCVFSRRGPKAAGAVWDVARRSTPHRWVVRVSRPEALSSVWSCSPVCGVVCLDALLVGWLSLGIVGVGRGLVVVVGASSSRSGRGSGREGLVSAP